MFKVSNGDIISNELYAPIFVKNIIESESLEHAANELASQGDEQTRRNMQEHVFGIKMHIIALQCANYFVLANILTNNNNSALQTIWDGFETSIASIFDPNANRHHPMVAQICGLMDDYRKVLWSDITQPQEEDFLSPSRCGKVFAQNIAGQCGIGDAININHLERIRLETVGNGLGPRILYSLMESKLLEYLPD